MIVKLYEFRKLFCFDDKHKQHIDKSTSDSLHSQRGSDERHEAGVFQRPRVTFQADKRRRTNKTVDIALDELKQQKSIT